MSKNSEQGAGIIILLVVGAFFSPIVIPLFIAFGSLLLALSPLLLGAWLISLLFSK